MAGELRQIFKGEKIIAAEAYDKIREGKPATMEALYHHSNDPIQRILIEMWWVEKGYDLEILTFNPEPKSYA